MRIAIALLLALSGLHLSCFAQTYPARPVKIVQGYPPGGPVDILARAMAAKFQELWGQAVVVESRPGAGTVIATEAVVKAAPDGYTIGLTNTPLVINPGLLPSMPYDTVRDVAGISLLTTNTIVLVAHPSVPAKSLAELIELAKKRPGKMSFASPGNGTSTHLAGALLNSRAGIQLVHVPYKGSVPALQDLLAGRVDVMFDVLQSSLPQVKVGKLRVLAVASPTRSAFAPEYPVMAETLAEFSVPSIMGLIAAKAVPREIVHKVYTDALAAMKSPDLAERIRLLYMEPVGSTPEEFDRFIRVEIEKWAAVVKASGAKYD